jgi:isopentenyl-diphosphate delta-isomerase
MRDSILAVDGRDRPNGPIDREAAHRVPGTRHRAYAITLEEDDQVLFARRSPEKKGWPGFWDATVASHPGPDENLERSALRRLKEELGLQSHQVTELQTVGKLEYEESYDEEYVEWEYCHFLRARIVSGSLQPNPSEVDALTRVSRSEISNFLQYENRPICPWFQITWNEFLNF